MYGKKITVYADEGMQGDEPRRLRTQRVGIRTRIKCEQHVSLERNVLTRDDIRDPARTKTGKIEFLMLSAASSHVAQGDVHKTSKLVSMAIAQLPGPHLIDLACSHLYADSPLCFRKMPEHNKPTVPSRCDLIVGSWMFPLRHGNIGVNPAPGREAVKLHRKLHQRKHARSVILADGVLLVECSLAPCAVPLSFSPSHFATTFVRRVMLQDQEPQT